MPDPAPDVVHLLPVFDPTGASHFLVRDDPAGVYALRAAPRDARYRNKALRAFWVERTHGAAVCTAAGAAVCAGCFRGQPCAAWDVEALTVAAFAPRTPGQRRPPPPEAPEVRAARVQLGLAPGFAPEELKAAFKRVALACHPDRDPAKKGDPSRLQHATEARNLLEQTAPGARVRRAFAAAMR